MAGHLIVRADADRAIGTGHVLRCLALAQAWKARGGQATFVTRCESAFLLRWIRAADIDVLELAPPPSADDPGTILAEIARGGPGQGRVRERPWVVTDGYHFDAAHHEAIRGAGYGLVVIDDTGHLPWYGADVLLNQNIHAETIAYRSDPGTRKLLGTRYALLRAEFLKWRGWQRRTSQVARKVLITMGGSDPDNATLRIVEAVRQLADLELEATVVAGPANPHLESLRLAAAEFPRLRIVPPADDMPELIKWADLAVSASGSTCWELAFLGLPSINVVLADNQLRIAEGLAAAGASINLGRVHGMSAQLVEEAIRELAASASRREEMSRAGRSLVDGEGAARVVATLDSLSPVRTSHAHSVSRQ